jgi:hypothetical protein
MLRCDGGTAGQTHCNVSLTVLAEQVEHGCPDPGASVAPPFCVRGASSSGLRIDTLRPHQLLPEAEVERAARGGFVIGQVPPTDLVLPPVLTSCRMAHQPKPSLRKPCLGQSSAKRLQLHANSESELQAAATVKEQNQSMHEHLLGIVAAGSCCAVSDYTLRHADNPSNSTPLGPHPVQHWKLPTCQAPQRAASRLHGRLTPLWLPPLARNTCKFY